MIYIFTMNNLSYLIWSMPMDMFCFFGLDPANRIRKNSWNSFIFPAGCII